MGAYDELRELIRVVNLRVDSLGRGEMSDAKTISDVRSGHSLVLETMGRICEGLHKAEVRIEALERGTMNHYGMTQHNGAVDASALRDRIEALEKLPIAWARQCGHTAWAMRESDLKEAALRACCAPAAPTCGTCLWYSGAGKNPTPYGSCHRYPPTPRPFDEVRGETPNSMWPTVEKHHACGEHSSKEER